MTKEEQEVFDYLEWFYCNSDFGPADEDVRSYLRQQYTKETGKAVPQAYSPEEE